MLFIVTLFMWVQSSDGLVTVFIFFLRWTLTSLSLWQNKDSRTGWAMLCCGSRVIYNGSLSSMRFLYAVAVLGQHDADYLWNDAYTCSPMALQNGLGRSYRPANSTILRHMQHTSCYLINSLSQVQHLIWSDRYFFINVCEVGWTH